LSCLAIGIAPVAVGLPHRLIFDHLRYTCIFGDRPRFGFGDCRRLNGCLPRCRLGLDTLLLLKLQTLAFNTPLFTSGGNGCARPALPS